MSYLIEICLVYIISEKNGIRASKTTIPTMHWAEGAGLSDSKVLRFYALDLKLTDFNPKYTFTCYTLVCTIVHISCLDKATMCEKLRK